MPEYLPSNPPVTADIHQLERYLREEHEAIRGSTSDIYALAQFIMDNFVVSGYGSISRTTADPIANIGATWQQLDWENAGIAEPRGMTYSLPDGLLVEQLGVWLTSVLINLSFAESNAGREIQFRLRNVTDGTVSNAVTFYVGRNQSGISIPITTLMQASGGSGMSISAVAVQKLIVVEINSVTDSFTGVSFEQGLWNLSYCSEYQGSIEDIGIAAR